MLDEPDLSKQTFCPYLAKAVLQGGEDTVGTKQTAQSFNGEGGAPN
jgi:hypothetical protein